MLTTPEQSVACHFTRLVPGKRIEKTGVEQRLELCDGRALDVACRPAQHARPEHFELTRVAGRHEGVAWKGVDRGELTSDLKDLCDLAAVSSADEISRTSGPTNRWIAADSRGK